MARRAVVAEGRLADGPGRGQQGRILLDVGQGLRRDGRERLPTLRESLQVGQVLLRGQFDDGAALGDVDLAGVNQACPTTPPTLRLMSSMSTQIGYNSNPSATTPIGMSSSTTLNTGALPSTFGTPSLQGNSIRVNLRAV